MNGGFGSGGWGLATGPQPASGLPSLFIGVHGAFVRDVDLRVPLRLPGGSMIACRPCAGGEGRGPEAGWAPADRHRRVAPLLGGRPGAGRGGTQVIQEFVNRHLVIGRHGKREPWRPR